MTTPFAEVLSPEQLWSFRERFRLSPWRWLIAWKFRVQHLGLKGAWAAWKRSHDSLYDLYTLMAWHWHKRIAIVGNGLSMCSYSLDDPNSMERVHYKSLEKYPYSYWTINGGWIFHQQSTLGWKMDDIRYPSPEHPNPDAYKSWVKYAPMPVMSSKAHPDYLPLVEFPLEAILKKFKFIYFSESINYMIAFAILCGVKEIDLYGCDYINCRPEERASVEFWCAIAHQQGVKLNISEESTLLCSAPQDPYFMPGFYGYQKEGFDMQMIQKLGLGGELVCAEETPATTVPPIDLSKLNLTPLSN